MHATGHRALGAVNGEEFLHLAQDRVKGPGFIAGRGFDHIAMHRIAGPKHIGPFGLHRADQARQVIAHIARAKARDQCQPARLILGVELGHQDLEVVFLGAGTAFQADRVLHTAAKLDMRAIRLARAIADPDHMTRPCKPFARGAINTAERLFILQQQGFMAGIEINRAQLMVRFARQASGRHEIKAVLDAVGHIAVFIRVFVIGEAERPAMHAVDIGKAPGRKRPQQVERGRSLCVGLQHPGRIGNARGRRGCDIIDDVALVAVHLDAADNLGRGRARLGELPGDAAHLDHGNLGAIGQHHRHLQHDLEGIADIVGREFRETFGAIAALKQESLTARGGGKLLFQPPRLARKDQWRVFRQLCLDAVKGIRVRVYRHLHARLGAPIGFGPSRSARSGHGGASPVVWSRGRVIGWLALASNALNRHDRGLRLRKKAAFARYVRATATHATCQDETANARPDRPQAICLHIVGPIHHALLFQRRRGVADRQSHVRQGTLSLDACR